MLILASLQIFCPKMPFIQHMHSLAWNRLKIAENLFAPLRRFAKELYVQRIEHDCNYLRHNSWQKFAKECRSRNKHIHWHGMCWKWKNHCQRHCVTLHKNATHSTHSHIHWHAIWIENGRTTVSIIARECCSLNTLTQSLACDGLKMAEPLLASLRNFAQECRPLRNIPLWTSKHISEHVHDRARFQNVILQFGEIFPVRPSIGFVHF